MATIPSSTFVPFFFIFIFQFHLAHQQTKRSLDDDEDGHDVAKWWEIGHEGHPKKLKEAQRTEDAFLRVGIYEMPKPGHVPQLQCQDFYTSVCSAVLTVPFQYSFGKPPNTINVVNLAQKQIDNQIILQLRDYANHWDHRNSPIARKMFRFYNKCLESLTDAHQLAMASEIAMKRLIPKMEMLGKSGGKLNADMVVDSFPHLLFLWLQKWRWHYMSTENVTIRVNLGLFYELWHISGWESQLENFGRKLLGALVEELEELIRSGRMERGEVPEGLIGVGGEEEVRRRVESLIEMEKYQKTEFDPFELDFDKENTVKLRELPSKFGDGSRVDWVQLFRSVDPDREYGPESEVTICMILLKKDKSRRSPLDILDQILRKFGGRKLQDYLEWDQILRHVSLLFNIEKFSKIFEEHPLVANALTYSRYFDVKEQGAEYAKVDATPKELQLAHQQHFCVKRSRKYFPEYIDRVFSSGMDQRFVDETYEIFGWLNKGFEQLFDMTSWLTNAEDKRRALVKLERMKQNSFIGQIEAVGNPKDLGQSGRDKLREIDEKYTRFYENIQDSLHFVDLTFSFTAQRQREILHHPELFYPISVSDAEGCHYFSWNAIMIGGGMLRAPFLSTGPNRSLTSNFAVMGTFLGHELGHGFDERGFKYNSEGDFDPHWWSEQSKNTFEERKKCFVEQYQEAGSTAKGLHVDGKRTLFENIADNTGIRIAYFALQKRLAEISPEELETEKRNTKALLGHNTKDHQHHMTIEQMFFTLYAHYWCGRTTPREMEKFVKTDVHAPRQLRVNVPLANFPKFAEAFGCNPGTPMNPKKKCTIWGDNIGGGGQ